MGSISLSTTNEFAEECVCRWGSLWTWHIMKICHPGSTLKGPELREESPLVSRGHNQRNDEGGGENASQVNQVVGTEKPAGGQQGLQREDNSKMLSKKRPRSTHPGMMEELAWLQSLEGTWKWTQQGPGHHPAEISLRKVWPDPSKGVLGSSGSPLRAQRKT